MPEISRFYGIIIKMFADEHNPQHFHAYFAEYAAIFSIHTGEMIEGDFPQKKSALVKAWAILHQDELIKNWKTLAEGAGAQKIQPLQ